MFAKECTRHGLQYSVVTDFPSWWLPGKSQLVVVVAKQESRGNCSNDLSGLIVAGRERESPATLAPNGGVRR
jgi:hypothetical protein